LRSLVRNFQDYDADTLTKLRLSAANTFTKLRTRGACCGHPGQPGC